MKKLLLPLIIAAQFGFSEPDAIAGSTVVTLRVLPMPTSTPQYTLPTQQFSLIKAKHKAKPTIAATIKKINGPTMLIFSQY